METMETMSSSRLVSNRYILLIYGYIKEFEKVNKLYMNIINGIIEIIIDFYPKIFKIDLYDTERFMVTSNGTDNQIFVQKMNSVVVDICYMHKKLVIKQVFIIGQ